MGNTKQKEKKEKQERLPESNDFELLKKSIEEKKKQGDIDGLDTLLNEVKNNNQLTEQQKKILNKQCEDAQMEIQKLIESEAENLKESIKREQITATADNPPEPPQNKKEMSRREKCKKRWGGLNNTEKTGAVAGTVVGIGAIRGISKLFGGKKKEEEDTKNKDNKEEHRYNKWRGKLGLVTTAGIVGLQVIPDSWKDKLTDFALTCKDKARDWRYDLTGRENEKPLDIENSLTAAQSNFMKTEHYEKIPSHLKLDYNQETNTVKAFGNEIKVNITNHIETSSIDGLDIKFKSYQELFETAFLIGFLKYLFQGKCENDINHTYFSLNQKSGDIDVKLDEEGLTEAVSGTGNQVTGICIGGAAAITALVAALTKNIGATVGIGALFIIGAILGGGYRENNNFLHDHCPSLDSTPAKYKLINYLNSIKGRGKGNQEFATLPDSKIKDEIKEIGEEMQSTTTSQSRGTERDIKAIPHSDDPNKLTLQSYQNEMEITINDSDPNNKILTIENLDIQFPVKEGIRFANLINYLKKTYPRGTLKSEKDDNDNFLYNYFYYDNPTFGEQGIYANIDDIRTTDKCILKDNQDNNKPGMFQTFFQNKEKCLRYINLLSIESDSIREKNTVNIPLPKNNGEDADQRQAA